MKKVSCNIIRDMLPLYVDDLVRCEMVGKIMKIYWVCL